MRTFNKRKKKPAPLEEEPAGKANIIWVFWFWVIVFVVIIYLLGGINGFSKLGRPPY